MRQARCVNTEDLRDPNVMGIAWGSRLLTLFPMSLELVERPRAQDLETS